MSRGLIFVRKSALPYGSGTLVFLAVRESSALSSGDGLKFFRIDILHSAKLEIHSGLPGGLEARSSRHCSSVSLSFISCLNS